MNPLTHAPEERVVLVDEQDMEQGTMEKLEAHRSGDLHRAISVFVMDHQGRMLLQQRAAGKYHSGGLWTNACCSHPRPGESPQEAAERRLKEEMGISAPVTFRFMFQYRAELENGLVEHELDHVFFATYAGPVRPDPEEVQDHAWYSLDAITTELEHHPERFTPWFRLCWDRIVLIAK